MRAVVWASAWTIGCVAPLAPQDLQGFPESPLNRHRGTARLQLGDERYEGLVSLYVDAADDVGTACRRRSYVQAVAATDDEAWRVTMPLDRDLPLGPVRISVDVDPELGNGWYPDMYALNRAGVFPLLVSSTNRWVQAADEVRVEVTDAGFTMAATTATVCLSKDCTPGVALAIDVAGVPWETFREYVVATTASDAEECVVARSADPSNLHLDGVPACHVRRREPCGNGDTDADELVDP